MTHRVSAVTEIREDYSFDKEEILSLICKRLRRDPIKVYDSSMDNDGVNITFVTKKYKGE